MILPFLAWLYIIDVDRLVKRQNFDGKEKSSSSRRANPKEYRGA